MNRLAQKALLLGVPGTCPETFLCCFSFSLFLVPGSGARVVLS